MSALPFGSPRSAPSVLDQKFVSYMREIERLYVQLSRHDQLRVEQWVSSPPPRYQ